MEAKPVIKRHNRWLRSREAAQYVGLSTSDLARKRMEGGGPRYTKLGNKQQAQVRYLDSDLEEWMSARMRSSTSQPFESAQ